MKYFAIFDKNIATIFQLQCKIGNISDVFLQYSVLCGNPESRFFSLYDTELGFEIKEERMHIVYYNILNVPKVLNVHMNEIYKKLTTIK